MNALKIGGRYLFKDHGMLVYEGKDLEAAALRFVNHDRSMMYHFSIEEFETQAGLKVLRSDLEMTEARRHRVG